MHACVRTGLHAHWVCEHLCSCLHAYASGCTYIYIYIRIGVPGCISRYACMCVQVNVHACMCVNLLPLKMPPWQPWKPKSSLSGTVWLAAMQAFPTHCPTYVPQFGARQSLCVAHSAFSPSAETANKGTNDFCNLDTCPLDTGLRPNTLIAHASSAQL